MPGRILVDTTPLRESRDFRLLFTGQLISMLGTQLTVVAIPYQVYSMTHSSLQVGAISLAQLIPFLVGALSAGPIGDLVDRRRIMVWTSATMVLTSGAMAVNAAVAHPSLVVLYVVSSLAAGLMGFSNTARMASVPGLVERRHLTAAFAIMQIIFQVGTVVGPALSGDPARHRAAARLLARRGFLRRGLPRLGHAQARSRRRRVAGACRRGSRPGRACATFARVRRCRASI